MTNLPSNVAQILDEALQRKQAADAEYKRKQNEEIERRLDAGLEYLETWVSARLALLPEWTYEYFGLMDADYDAILTAGREKVFYRLRAGIFIPGISPIHLTFESTRDGPQKVLYSTPRAYCEDYQEPFLAWGRHKNEHGAKLDDALIYARQATNELAEMKRQRDAEQAQDAAREAQEAKQRITNDSPAVTKPLKYCPLMSAGRDNDLVDCIYDKCAWWTGCHCAMLSLSISLDAIALAKIGAS